MITTMYDTANIFGREVGARRDLLWVGVAAALLVLILPFVPGASNLDPGDVRSAAAFGFALGAGVVLSVGLGASLFGRDLSEQRLGFFFERPVNTTAVWLGRFAAVYLLVIACEGVILAAGGAWLSQSALLDLAVFEIVKGVKLNATSDWLLWFAVGPVFLLLLSHCLSVMVRARTVWLAVDLTGAVVASIAAWIALRPLVEGGFERAAGVVGLGIVAAVLLALLAGTAIGLAQGRTDLRRTHRFLSTALWGTLVVTLGGMLGYSAWLRAFDPWDFDGVGVGHVSPGGRWVEVHGGAKGHLDVRRHFLVSTDGERHIPIPSFIDRWRLQAEVRVSADGSRAVWLKAFGEDELGTVWWVDLKSAPLEPVATMITLPRGGYFEVSPDGTTVAFLEERTLSVFDLKQERLITMVQMEDDARHLLFRYTDPTNLRLMNIRFQVVDDYEWERFFSISDVAVERGAKALKRNTIHEPNGQYLRIDRGLEYAVPGFTASRYPRRALHLPQRIFDAASGEFEKEVRGLFGGFLPAGRFWSVDVSSSGNAVLVIDSLQGDDDASESDIGTLPDWFAVGGNVDEAVFFASEITHWGGLREITWKEIVILDPDSGQRRVIGEELEIIGLYETQMEFPDGVCTTFYEVWTPTTLFRDQRGALLVYDPELDSLKPIAGRVQE